MKNNLKKRDNCPVLTICHLLGKKWMCPLIVNLEPYKCYNFEEIIKISSRQINRTLLSNLLKEMISSNIINNESDCYCLSEKGIQIKGILKNLKEIILKDHSVMEIDDFKKNCLVNSFKF
jgi:DNA-binding HxlR family transcriptional regulator